MPVIGQKRNKFFRTLTAREQAEVFRERRKAARERFESLSAAADSAFGAALSNQIAGRAEIIARIAAKRALDELNKKISQTKVDLKA
jgi:hypothetical protein